MLLMYLQLGCYVPCENCVISVVDIIFTRLGATDRIMAGESKFSNNGTCDLWLHGVHAISCCLPKPIYVSIKRLFSNWKMQNFCSENAHVHRYSLAPDLCIANPNKLYFRFQAPSLLSVQKLLRCFRMLLKILLLSLMNWVGEQALLMAMPLHML